MDGMLLDIQRGNIHDGPGLRTTVFLKGCPLRCAWCHNPESQSPLVQLSLNRSRCVGCRTCEPVCPLGLHTFDDGRHDVDFANCRACGRCAEVCPTGALRLYGKRCSPEEVFAVVQRDRDFYRNSGGGMTLSGGEPLAQPEFSRELLRLCREDGIHTCVETSGFGLARDFDQLLPLTDLFLFDWKVDTREEALRWIGVPPEPIFENLERVLHAGGQVLLRCPIIPGVNNTEAHFGTILGLLERFPTLLGAELLPYHDFGAGKEEALGRDAKRFRKPSEEEQAGWLTYFSRKLEEGHPAAAAVTLS